MPMNSYENEEYNGWTNRETWSMNLWITNEPHWDEHARKLACSVVWRYVQTPNTERDIQRAIYDLKLDIREYFDEEFSWEYVKDNENLYNVVREIGSLDRVNWYEIAEHFYHDEAFEINKNLFQS